MGELLAKFFAQNLPGSASGQRFDDINCLGTLVCREMGAKTSDNLLAVVSSTGAQDDGCDNSFYPMGVGDTEYCSLQDGRIAA
jgi:hypothetical protein